MRIVSWFRTKGLLYFVRLFLMTVLTSFNFWLAVIRWGWADTDPVIKTSALIVAGVTEIGLFAFLILFSQQFYGRRHFSALLGWGVSALACAGVSLYVNIGYFQINWHDQTGNTLADLLIRALFPMALLLAFSMIPPKQQKIRTVAEVQQEYAGRIAEAEMKLKLTEITEDAKEKRRRQRAEEEAKRVQLRRMAGAELLAEFTVYDEDGLAQIDYLGLAAAVEDRNRLAALPSAEEMIAAMVADEAPEEVADEDDAMSVSGNHRAYLSAQEVAQLLSVSEDTAKRMMEARSAHPYAIRGCKNIRLRKPRGNRRHERRAPYATVLEVKAQMEAKPRPVLRPETQPELQAVAL